MSYFDDAYFWMNLFMKIKLLYQIQNFSNPRLEGLDYKKLTNVFSKSIKVSFRCEIQSSVNCNRPLGISICSLFHSLYHCLKKEDFRRLIVYTFCQNVPNLSMCFVSHGVINLRFAPVATKRLDYLIKMRQSLEICYIKTKSIILIKNVSYKK